MDARELPAVESDSQIVAREVTRLFGWKSRTAPWEKVAEGNLEPRYPEPHKPRWCSGEIVEVLEKRPKVKANPRGLKVRVEPTDQQQKEPERPGTSRARKAAP